MDKYRIMLADDHAMFRKGLRNLIEVHNDLQVVGEAGRGPEIMPVLRASAPDMVILDISMPDFSLVDAVSEIKRKYVEVKALVLSMHKEYLHQAMSAGADGYLLKQDTEHELFSAIATIRQGKAYLSPCLLNIIAGELKRKTLTLREKEVLKLIASGNSNKEIADSLSLSVRTVESHRARLMGRLNLKNAAALTSYAIQQGFVDIP